MNKKGILIFCIIAFYIQSFPWYVVSAKTMARTREIEENQVSMVLIADNFTGDGWSKQTDSLLTAPSEFIKIDSADAECVAEFYIPQEGDYNVWVYCKNYQSTPNNRVFKIAVDGITDPTVFADVNDDNQAAVEAGGKDGCWFWQKGSEQALSAGYHQISIKNKSIFSRFAAVYITDSDVNLCGWGNTEFAANFSQKIDTEAPDFEADSILFTYMDEKTMAVSWTNISDSSGVGAYTLSVGDSVIPQDAIEENRYILRGVQPFRRYKIMLCAKDGVGNIGTKTVEMVAAPVQVCAYYFSETGDSIFAEIEVGSNITEQQNIRVYGGLFHKSTGTLGGCQYKNVTLDTFGTAERIRIQFDTPVETTEAYAIKIFIWDNKTMAPVFPVVTKNGIQAEDASYSHIDTEEPVGEKVCVFGFEPEDEIQFINKKSEILEIKGGLDTEVKRSGETALKLYNTVGTQLGNSYRVDYDNIVDGYANLYIEPGRTYQIDFWYYMEGFARRSANSYGLSILLIPCSGKTAAGSTPTFRVPAAGDEQWTKGSIQYSVPKTFISGNGSVYTPDRLRIIIRFSDAVGAVWLDDISLTRGILERNKIEEPVFSTDGSTRVRTAFGKSMAMLTGSNFIYDGYEKRRADDNSIEVKPYQSGSTIMLPLNAVAKGMGATLAWDGENKKAILGYQCNKINIEEGMTTIAVGEKELSLDTPVANIGGCLYISQQTVEDLFGKAVFCYDNGLITIGAEKLFDETEDAGLIRDAGLYLSISDGLCCTPVLEENPDTPESVLLPFDEYTGDRAPVTLPSIVIEEPTREALDKAMEDFEFKDEGLLNSLAELDFIKGKIEAGVNPWKSNFEKMKKSQYALRDYEPSPFPAPYSGINGANSQGAEEEGADAAAAYTQALMWYFTGDEVYAENTVKILNAWAETIQTHDGANWYLNTGWYGSVFPQAAQIMKLTYPKWTEEEQQKLVEAFNRAYLPILNNRMAYGNRFLSVCNALVAIGVFNEDKAAFYQGVYGYLSYIPCYIYLEEDGPEPIYPDYWLTQPTSEEYYEMIRDKYPDRETCWVLQPNNPRPGSLGDDNSMMTSGDINMHWYYPGAYIDGLAGEMGRDLGHTDMAVSAAINIAEIAWNQGIDLYSIFTDRFVKYSELQSQLRLSYIVPDTLYRGAVSPTDLYATGEILYNHYHNRMGIELPFTYAVINPHIRAASYTSTKPQANIFANNVTAQSTLHIKWETLTHAELSQRIR